MILALKGTLCCFPKGQRDNSVHAESGEKTGEGGLLHTPGLVLSLKTTLPPEAP